jgi:hypothetical protein
MLFCPADSQRQPPGSWPDVDFDRTSYVLCRAVPAASATRVLATCAVHGFQVQVDGTVLAPGREPLAPRLEVLAATPAGAILVTVHGLPGTECVVESSPDLLNWTPFTTQLVPADVAQLTIAAPPDTAPRFYRAAAR